MAALLGGASGVSALTNLDAPGATIVDRTTALAVFVFFSQCAASFGDYRQISPKALEEFKAEALKKHELTDGDVIGWRLHGPRDERLTLRLQEPGQGCHVEARHADPDGIHSNVADMLRLVSARRSAPHRLLSEKRFEIRSTLVWRRTYLMSERDTPTVAIMVTTGPKSPDGGYALITYQFVSDPY
jgi:hypothetical protein